jgi:hypothetical protein
MSRNATFEEVQQPPATREIANVANITHPYLQSSSSSVAYVVGGASLTATVNIRLKDGFGNAFQGMVHISAGPDVDTATPSPGTRLSAAPAGNAPFSLDVLADASGVVTVPVVFHAAGAALSKQIVVEYGNYRVTVTGLTVTA